MDHIMYTLLAADQGFFIELLEKGGLPALAIGMCFTIFMFWLKSNSKIESKREDARQKALLAVAAERVEARHREAIQYAELMKAYEDMVGLLFDLSKESTKAVTRLSERISYCPYREPYTTPITVNEEISDG